MKHLRYKGEFLSVSGIVWRVEILQEAEAAFDSVGDLDFPADEPLVIEWDEKDKEEVVCGSTATLKIISPGDRTYEDMYTIEVGRIRMDVYRDDALYWSGALDPEFYEEPYEQARDYEVSFTFSDFGILDRIKYGLTGMQTLRGIVEHALRESCMNYVGIDTGYVSTTFTDGDGITGGGLSVRSDNFTDEEGEVSTLYEVLEGILQPLAIRIVQRAGTIYLYDLNGLYTLGTGQEIRWDGDRQTMGTDKVANNIRVSFSPYSSAVSLDGEIEYTAKYSVEKVNYDNVAVEEDIEEYGEYYSYYPDYGDHVSSSMQIDHRLIDFTIFIHDKKGSGLAYLGSQARYFHILPMTGGASETSGVAYFFYTGGPGDLRSGKPKKKINTAVKKGIDSVLMRSNRVYLPAGVHGHRTHFVRVSLEMLLDPRYNPFSEPSDDNEYGNHKMMKGRAGWVFVPVAITLYDEDGSPVMHYDNRIVAEKATHASFSALGGRWVEGAASFGDAWLEYYDPQDQKDGAGILGWKANRHCIGRPDNGTRLFLFDSFGADFYESFRKMDDGEYIYYPDKGGYLEVAVYEGVRCFDYGEDGGSESNRYGFDNTAGWDEKELYDKIRWLLYKAPKVEVVRNNLVFDEAELEDVEYSGYINRAAKEEIQIDTICGTAYTVCPTARGTYYRTSTSGQLETLKRAGKEDHPEKLLIGTMYSQYATRKTALSGKASIDPGLHYYTERNQGAKRFMLKGDVQDVITDCTEAVYCEFRPDEYDSIEEVS